ncbi:MAG: phenylalanine--tRNA ligase beta subunit-related protein [Pirellulaceae bacterium]
MLSNSIKISDHPLLDAACIVAQFAQPLGEATSPPGLTDLLSLDADSPFEPDEQVKTCVRKLLRHGGHQPSGRGKPSSEYLQKAVGEDRLGSINPAVDICNVVSLHSGLPISVIDLARSSEPFEIRVADDETEYVFNASGQSIKLKGLLCLHDADGPCANAVKDSHRTKTSDTTTRTLSIIWGTTTLPRRTEQAANWYRELLQQVGASVA